MTSGPLSQPAAVTVAVGIKTSLSTDDVRIEDHFSSADDAEEATSRLVAFVCRGATEQYLSQSRLQSMTGSGPLVAMDELELDLFGRYACLCACREATEQLSGLLSQFASSATVAPLDSQFQVRTGWGVLPRGHEQRLDGAISSLLKRVAKDAALEEKEIEDDICALTESETEDLEKGYGEAVAACFLAYIFDRSLKLSDAVVYEATVKILRRVLEKGSASAAPDALMPQSAALTAALGEQHPVAAWFEELARQNLSPQKRTEAAERQSRLDAALKARVLEQQWPNREQLSAEMMREREESTPVPERVWALRNVARTLVMGSAPTESAADQAISLMKKALRLQQKHLADARHPGMLGPLRDYAQVLDRIEPGVSYQIWEQIAAILEEVVERYRRQGDLFSAAVVAEAGVLEGEKVLDVTHPSVKKLGKTAEALSAVLDEKQKTRFLGIRRGKRGMEMTVDAFTEKLAVYKSPEKLDRIDAWSQNKPLDPI